MPISVYSEDQIFEIAVAAFARQPTLAKLPVGESSYLGQKARSLAQLLAQVLGTVKAADNDSLPVVTYTSGVPSTSASTLALDNWAFTLGLPSNRGLGQFGRNGAQAATGGTAQAVGTAGLILVAGLVLTDLSGTVSFQLRTGVTIPISGTIGIVVDAVTVGKAGNLASGTKLRWQSPPPGLATVTTLTGAVSGGYDQEDDVHLALRIISFLQDPPQGGTATDIRRWAEAATDSDGRSVGVVRAYVYPLRDGVGSVAVVPLLGGSGAGRDPGATKAAQIQAYIDARRIATDTITVLRPQLPAGKKLTLTLRVKPAAGYAWDWEYGGLSTPVVSAVGTTLIINTLTPVPLATAINNGSKPRIQLIGGSPIPQVVRVLSFTDNLPLGGQATLVVDSTLSGAPTEMYPAGGAVLPVALAVQSLLDTVIGPSRASGYAAPLDTWQDVVSVAAIAQTALDAVGADGQRALVLLPNAGADPSASVGVSIAIGVGLATTRDYQLEDATPGLGPQIPEVAQIVVLEG